jgi:hypothetical protein
LKSFEVVYGIGNGAVTIQTISNNSNELKQTQTIANPDLWFQDCFDNRNMHLNGSLQKQPFHRFKPSEAAPASPGK